MQLLTASQIREWDQYTIQHEPISSTDLMERAARCFTDWFFPRFLTENSLVTILCGNGNNGGDGLAIARMLRDRSVDVQVYMLRLSSDDSADVDVNLARLLSRGDVPLHFIHDTLPEFDASSICIDALLGTGVTRPLTGIAARLVDAVNATGFRAVVSVDMPSGLPADELLDGTAVQADTVFTFQVPKRSFFYEEHALFCAQWVVGNIGLHSGFIKDRSFAEYILDNSLARQWIRHRSPYAHKGHFGHVRLVAGSEGRVGAAILASQAAMRSGCGWTTALVPSVHFNAVLAAIPEVMCVSQDKIKESDTAASGMFAQRAGNVLHATGCGPAIGTDGEGRRLLEAVLAANKGPLLLDADALTLLALHPDLWNLVPEQTILTPHPGEFARLFGHTTGSTETMQVLTDAARRHRVIIVLKGRYTRIALPDGTQWINTTGNAGMATAGSGDVLTGIITSLLAQGYPSWQAAVLGVYLHGMAADRALAQQSVESLIASDISAHLGIAFRFLKEAIV